MYVKEVNENMWDEIYLQGVDIITRFFDKWILLLSIIWTMVLSAIGFPNQIIVFIVGLVIIDLISKHISIVIANYGSLTFKNYFNAWGTRVLTSRQLKNGIGVKTIMYACLLYISNQLAIVDGILLGQEISYVIYNSIILVEISSILENFIIMGGKGLQPLSDYIKNKYRQILGIDK